MKLKIILYCLLIALGAATTYQFGPRQAQVSERTVTKDKVVTVVREVKSPDGTVIRDERTERDTRQDSRVEVALPQKPDWAITGGIGLRQQYMIGVQRRILGNVFIGAQIDTERNLLATLTFTF